MMNSLDSTIMSQGLGQLRILLPGIPGVSSRGYLGYCTVVLFPLDDGWALFDTGHYSDRNLLIAALSEAGVSPSSITHVVLSHLHFDHALNVPLFKNAIVYVTQAELDYADMVRSGQAIDHSIPDFWPLLFENRQVQIVEGMLELSSLLRLKHLPGHTPGCLTMFYDGPLSVAVCGDVIKNAWEAVKGESSMALAGSEAAKTSIADVLERASVVIPGHDRPFMRSKEGVKFLTPFQWEVRTSIYPDEQDKPVLRLNLPDNL
ncbi:MAG: MBL fold metallo-hydrolase [Desulfobacteraceae bacterium]|nr:MAG: MBL fold metallo-hydrolase [Desulfobacteraceae bacterium]